MTAVAVVWMLVEVPVGGTAVPVAVGVGLTVSLIATVWSDDETPPGPSTARWTAYTPGAG